MNPLPIALHSKMGSHSHRSLILLFVLAVSILLVMGSTVRGASAASSYSPGTPIFTSTVVPPSSTYLGTLDCRPLLSRGSLNLTQPASDNDVQLPASPIPGASGLVSVVYMQYCARGWAQDLGITGWSLYGPSVVAEIHSPCATAGSGCNLKPGGLTWFGVWDANHEILIGQSLPSAFCDWTTISVCIIQASPCPNPTASVCKNPFYSTFLATDALQFGIGTDEPLFKLSVGSSNIKLYLNPTSSVTVPSATGAGSITLATSSGIVAGVVPVSESTLPAAGKPVGVTFPYGFLSWRITGLQPSQQATVTLAFPTPLPANSVYWKVDQTGAWINMCQSPGNCTVTGSSIAISMTAGPTGEIVDPGGLGVPAVAVPPLTITPPPDVTLEVGVGCASSANIGTPTVAGGSPPVTITSSVTAPFPIGLTLVTWTATDSTGQTAQATQKVTVVDTTPPVLTVPAPIIVTANTPTGWTGSLATASATDACPVTITNDAPTVFPIGTTVVFYIGADAAGNAASASTTVTVLPFIVTLTASTSLSSDVNEQLVIGADNIVLNCNGHSVRGITPVPFTIFSGIYINGRHGVTVKNCHVENFFDGFKVVSSTGIVLVGNSASDNFNNGFYLSRTQYSLLLRNIATGNAYGFQVIGSSRDVFAANNSTANQGGFLVVSSWRNAFAGNVANNNFYSTTSAFKDGFGFTLTNSSYNLFFLNTFNNNQKWGLLLNYSSNNNLIIANSGCGNGLYDAAVDATSTGNMFDRNKFCKSSGIPPLSPSGND